MNTGPTPEEIDAQFKAFQTGLGDATIATENLTASEIKAKKQAEEMSASFKNFGTSVLNTAKQIAQGAEGASTFNGAIESGADAISKVVSKFGIFGKIIGLAVKGASMYATAVTKQADALNKTYKDIAKVGASGAEGISGVFSNLQKLGYTVAEVNNFASLLKENSAALAQFGGTVASGTKSLADVGEKFKSEGLYTKFETMGIAVDDANKGIANYMRLQTKTGLQGRETTDQLKDSAQKYIMQQDRLAKLTGISADQQQKLQEQALNDQRVAAEISELKAKGDEASLKKAQMMEDINVRLNDVAPKMRDAMLKYASGGYLNDEEVRKYQRMMPETFEMIRKGNVDANKIIDSASAEAKKKTGEYRELARQGGADKFIGDYAEGVRVAGMSAENLGKTQEELDEQAKNAQTITDKTTKSLAEMNMANRGVAQASDLLINKGIGPVTEGLAGIAKMLDQTATGTVGSVEAVTSSLTGGGGKTGSEGSALRSDQDIYKSDEFKKWREKMGGGGLMSSSIYDKKFGVDAYKKAQAAEQSVASSGSAPPPHGAPAAPSTPAPKEEKKPEAVEVAVPTGRPGSPSANKAVQQEEARLAALEAKANDDIARANKARGSNTKIGELPTLTIEGIEARQAAEAATDPNYMARQAQFAKKRAELEAKRAAPNSGYANGGIASGPKSGFEALLHGTEAIVPLPDGNSIPVQMGGMGGGALAEQNSILSSQLDRLNELIRVVQNQVSVSNKMLQRAS